MIFKIVSYHKQIKFDFIYKAKDLQAVQKHAA